MTVAASDVILSPRAAAALDVLEQGTGAEEASLVRRIRSLRAVLIADCLHGEVVRKRTIPRNLRAEYDLENLYVEDLPSFWRLLYTIVRIKGRPAIVIIEIVDHPQYTKWFRGRT